MAAQISPVACTSAGLSAVVPRKGKLTVDPSTAVPMYLKVVWFFAGSAE